MSLARNLLLVPGIVAATFGVVAAAAAQRAMPPRPVPLSRAISDSAGLREVGGELVGCGRNYKAYFRSDGVEYVPMLGSAAPRNLPLRLWATRAGRGTDRAELPLAVPAVQGLAVRYDRGTCHERYELRPGGMEQSFVFDALPAGSGDLVVECACTTELPLALPARGEAVRFFEPGVGGIAIGEVTGIDADGDTVRGTARYRDGVLELRLPAAFVDTAALPVVLDPVVTTLQVAGGSSLVFPDVAWVPGTWLVVYQVVFSGSDSDIWSHAVDEATLTISNTLPLTAIFNGVEQNPGAAAVRDRGQFVVTYGRIGQSFQMASVIAVRPDGTITDSAFFQSALQPVVCGSSRSFSDRAFVLWTDSSLHAVRGRAIRLDAQGDFDLSSPIQTVVSDPVARVGNVAVCRARGEGASMLAAYTTDLPGVNATGVSIVVFGTSMTAQATAALVPPGINDNDLPAVDGDGRRFVVAWESATSAGQPNDIVCQPVQFNGTLVVSPPATVAGNSRDELDATVGVLGRGALVGWAGANVFGDFGSVVASVDMDFCDSCEGRFTVVDNIGRDEFAPRIAAVSDPAGQPGERALLVVDRPNSFSFGGGIWGYVFEGEDGEQTRLALGAFSGGVLSAPCAVVGNSDFRVARFGGSPNASTYLMLSADAFGLQCGGFRVVPDPLNGWVVPRTTDLTGRAFVALPIPATSTLRGAALYAQWVTPGTSAASCVFAGIDVHLSDAQLIRIE